MSKAGYFLNFLIHSVLFSRDIAKASLLITHFMFHIMQLILKPTSYSAPNPMHLKTLPFYHLQDRLRKS